MSYFPKHHPTHPGHEASNNPIDVFSRLTANEREFRGWPGSVIAAMGEGFESLLSFGGIIPYVAGIHTETIDNSSTIAQVAGGIRGQTDSPATDNDDITIAGIKAVTLAADKPIFALCRVQASVANAMGISFGVVTAGTVEVYTANPADGVFITKAKNAATPVVGRVVENGNAADDLTLDTDADGTDLTMANATDNVLGFWFVPNATLAKCYGAWYVDGFVQPFTAAQLDAVQKMLATTPPSLSAIIGGRVNGTTQRSWLAAHANVFVQRFAA